MRLKSYLGITALAFCAACQSVTNDEKEGLSPARALQSFQIYEGFEIELVASEPLVADPVAMEVDELGRTFVLEMHGYPLDLSGSGLIKELIDSDGDGVFDESKIFADSLKLPTGLMRWKNGLLVVDVPDVVYLEDTDGDGRADRKEIILTGFAVTNPQHIANTPIFGLDNWIYIAHQGSITPKVSVAEFSDEGAEVRFAGRTNGAVLPVDANGRNVRLRPDTYELEMLSGESQYGQTFDPWGHHFGTSNADHLFVEIIAARYLSRNPHLMIADASENIPDHGDAAEVFPITKSPEHQLLTDVGVITSSCGITWYQGGLFEGFDDVTFVAEPVHNLVHADRIQPRGASFSASRLSKNSEFLASTDPWFRPVQFYIGPDGALYIIDYYRQIVEHPEWMSEEVNKSEALYNGSKQGRIYRITPKGTGKMTWPGKIDMAALGDGELVQMLENDNIWWRRNAQRMLLDRKGDRADTLLDSFIQNTTDPKGLVHGLWSLQGLGQLKLGQLELALRHPEGGVRENAIRLAELHLSDWPELNGILLALQNDPDPKVRFQLLCTLGFIDTSEALKARNFLLQKDVEDKWVHVAALSASYGKEIEVLNETVKRFSTGDPSEGKSILLANIASVIALSGDEENIIKAIRLALSGHLDSQSVWWRTAIVTGIDRVVPYTGLTAQSVGAEFESLKRTFHASTPAPFRSASVSLLAHLQGISASEMDVLEAEAFKIALDPATETDFRIDALSLLGASKNQIVAKSLIGLVNANEPDGVQKGAINVMMVHDHLNSTAWLIEKWPTLTPSVRDYAIGQFMEREETMLELLAAIEQKRIDQAAPGWPRSVSLMNNDSEIVRKRAREVLGSINEKPDEVYEKHKEALVLEGSVVDGKVVFENNCSICHQKGGQNGRSFGPDLATIRNRDPEFILADILNPNRSIADGFEIWEVTMRDGSKIGGVIASETSVALTISDAAGNETIVNRKDVAVLKVSEISGMPGGLGYALTVEQMADLITYLKN